MGIEYESVVDHPLAEVFAWHTRPGAMRRLVPPWQPMKVVAETESLADGRAVLGLPGGLRWVAQHDPAGFDPPHRFVDVLSSAGPGVVAGTRHRLVAAHPRVQRDTSGDTGVRPRRHHGARGGAALDVRLPAPAAGRRPGRTSRRRRCRCETDGRGGHGASGLVGIRVDGVSEHRWAPGDPAGATAGARRRVSGSGNRTRPAPDLLSGVDAVVHLAGASIAGRFTDAHKAAIRDSRIEPTRGLAEAAAAPTTARAPSSAPRRSAIYGFDRGDALLCEESVRGDGFLADVVADWEAATAPAARRGCGWSPCAPESCSPRAAARCG